MGILVPREQRSLAEGDWINDVRFFENQPHHKCILASSAISIRKRNARTDDRAENEPPRACFRQSKKVERVPVIARSLPGYSDRTRGPALSDWQILEKSDLLGREHLFTSIRSPLRTSASTGGTTGQPLRLQRSLAGVAYEQATIDQLCQQADVNAQQARVAVLRGDSIVDASSSPDQPWIDQGKRRRIYSAHHLCKANAQAYSKSLADYAPDILFCYPSSLDQLMRLIQSPAPKIPLIFVSSEMLDKTTAAHARDMFAAKLIDFYGHAERVVCASSFDSENYWFDPAYGHVELVPNGNGLAEILATSTRAHGQVFVRYRTGDLVRIESDDPRYLFDVASGLRPFQGIEGRKNEFVQLPGGQRIIGLNHIPRGVTGIQRLQLHHSDGWLIEVIVTPRENFGRASIMAIEANLQSKFPAQTRFKYLLSPKPIRERNGKSPLLLRNPVLDECIEYSFQGTTVLEYQP